MKTKLPELLLPAWDLEKAYIAFKYWADAIYCWIPMFSLRTRMNVFTEKDIEEIIQYAHSIWKKVYVTLNGFPHQNMITSLRKHLQFLSKVNPDWLIIADSWVLYEANIICPNIPKHLSVQASTVSESWMRFWYQSWVKRIILAREISIKEVKDIHKLFPEIELEYFVHWAVCMAYSWRCLLSNFMAHRDANRWMCAHSCRWKYDVIEFNSENIREYEQNQVWKEEMRPWELIPVEQDFHWTHIMSSRDMCMIEHLEEIINSWICSLKIEWRNKTIYYLASVWRAYRQALDDINEWKKFDKNLWNEIHATANRWFFAWFLHWKPWIEWQQYEENRSISTHEFCWQILKFFEKWEILLEDFEWFKKWFCFDENMILINVRNRINKWNEITFIYPKISDDKLLKVNNLFKNWEKKDSIHWWDWNAWIWIWDTVIQEWILLRQKVANWWLI